MTTPYQQGFDDAMAGQPIDNAMLRSPDRQSYLNDYYHAELERRQTDRFRVPQTQKGEDHT